MGRFYEINKSAELVAMRAKEALENVVELTTNDPGESRIIEREAEYAAFFLSELSNLEEQQQNFIFNFIVQPKLGYTPNWPKIERCLGQKIDQDQSLLFPVVFVDFAFYSSGERVQAICELACGADDEFSLEELLFLTTIFSS